MLLRREQKSITMCYNESQQHVTDTRLFTKDFDGREVSLG
jgi:hypothetical protein